MNGSATGSVRLQRNFDPCGGYCKDASMKRLTIEVDAAHRVSALLDLPPTARALYVLAHGAGAGMGHPFMQAVASGLAERSIASLRYQFPYMERHSRRPDAPALCHATVRSAVDTATRQAPSLPLVAGGKSFGARMTSQTQADQALPGVHGLAFLGFPLHPPGAPGSERAEHLTQVAVPMLFLQGTRDELAELTRVRTLVAQLGERAALHVLQDADHSFHVPARSGRTDAQVMTELLDTLVDWIEHLVLAT